ncbi:MAG: Uma2 family endonuclease [Chloroflexota bacterium]
METTATIAPPLAEEQPSLADERLITGKEFAMMADLGRAELIEGRIVKMPPPQDLHGNCESNFHLLIAAFVKENQLGKVRVGESGVYVRRNPDTVRGMDVAFISNERWAQRKSTEGYLEIAPDLVVEVLSPDDRWGSVTRKLQDYFSIGVRLVWVADPQTRKVYVCQSLNDIHELAEADTLTGGEVLPGFSVPVASLFEE